MQKEWTAEQRSYEMKRYENALKATYFSNETPVSQLSQMDVRNAFNRLVAIVDCFSSKSLAEQSILKYKANVLMAQQPLVNTLYSLDKEGEKYDLATRALSKKALDLAEVFINGEDQELQQARNNFEERESRYESQSFEQDDEEVYPKTELQKAILLSLFATQEQSFGCYDKSEKHGDLAYELITRCNVNPHFKISVKSLENPADTLQNTPFMHFLQAHYASEQDVRLPYVNSDFYAQIDPKFENFENDNFLWALIKLHRPKDAAFFMTSLLKNKPENEYISYPKKEHNLNHPFGLEPEQPNLFGCTPHSIEPQEHSDPAPSQESPCTEEGTLDLFEFAAIAQAKSRQYK